MRNTWIAGLLGLAIATPGLAANMSTSFYGYLESYYEKVDDQPAPNSTAKSSNPGEFNTPNINVIMQSNMKNTKAFLNLSGADGGTTSVKNAWVEYQFSDKLALQYGKLYRPFGLYNEILDAVPTYIGIEPPELFDGDHLLLTRTTNLMLHGKYDLSNSLVKWALTTGNDDATGNNTPLGLDVKWLQGNAWKVGLSYYTTGGEVNSTDGNGGSTKHFTKEEYTVTGLYGQYRDDHWTVQAAYYVSPHTGTRDTATYCAYTTIDDFRKQRAGCNTTPITAGEFDVTTYYARVGYDFYMGSATLTPYFQYDYYKNPEIPFSKSEGGDKEAGLSSDGSFVKATVGAVYRPEYNLALKVDYSQHMQDVDTTNDSTVNGSANNYGEYRVSLSYFWKL